MTSVAGSGSTPVQQPDPNQPAPAPAPPQDPFKVLAEQVAASHQQSAPGRLEGHDTLEIGETASKRNLLDEGTRKVLGDHNTQVGCETVCGEHGRGKALVAATVAAALSNGGATKNKATGNGLINATADGIQETKDDFAHVGQAIDALTLASDPCCKKAEPTPPKDPAPPTEPTPPAPPAPEGDKGGEKVAAKPRARAKKAAEGESH